MSIPLARKRGADGMEKSELEKFGEYKGDFEPLPDAYAIGGYSHTTPKNGKPPQDILVVIRKTDGLEISLFANQLRQEGGKLCVSRRHLEYQSKQAEAWRGAASK